MSKKVPLVVMCLVCTSAMIHCNTCADTVRDAIPWTELFSKDWYYCRRPKG